MDGASDAHRQKSRVQYITDEFASRTESPAVRSYRGALITMQIHLSAALTTKSSKSQTRWPAAFSGADGRRTTNQQQLLRHRSNKNRTSGVTDIASGAQYLRVRSACCSEASLIIFCTDGDVNSLPRRQNFAKWKLRFRARKFPGKLLACAIFWNCARKLFLTRIVWELWRVVIAW